jgi:hypothetical protein
MGLLYGAGEVEQIGILNDQRAFEAPGLQSALKPTDPVFQLG